MRQVIGGAALAGCAALAVAGCGTAHVTAGGPASTAASTPAASTPAGSPSPSASPAATPRQRAVADAASMLASFVPPPGAVRLPGDPGGAVGGALSQPGTATLPPYLVDDSSWWRVPGQQQGVLAWERAHLPRQFTAAGSTSVGPAGSSAALGEQFSLPAVPSVLDPRELTVETVASGGQTVVRVDAQVTWWPAKPASERVPSAAKVVTVAALPGMVAGAKLPTAVTVTDPSKVERIAALVDSLPVSPPEMLSCPVDLGLVMLLTFRATVGGPALAVVAAHTTGCGGVSFTVDGKTQPRLSGGASLGQQVAAIAGLDWPGYGGASTPGAP